MNTQENVHVITVWANAFHQLNGPMELELGAANRRVAASWGAPPFLSVISLPKSNHYPEILPHGLLLPVS